MMWVHAITLFQRPGSGAVSERPVLFWDKTDDEVCAKLRRHIDEEFDLEGFADPESLAAYAAAGVDFQLLAQWFDDHYCFFEIQLHEQDIGE